MNILGLSFDFHDAAAALVQDGRVVAAAQEERFSRIKNDPSFPRQAAAFCLEEACLRPGQLDSVVFYERPLEKFDRIVQASLLRWPASEEYLRRTLQLWAVKRKLHVARRIREELGVPRRKVRFVDHHNSHAASAYYCSPFSRATVVTFDGVGEYDTLTISRGEGTRLERLATQTLPHSLGLFYSALTAFLGFRVNEDEYKVMGMAGYGRPVHSEEMLGWFTLHDDGTFRLRQDFFDFLCPRDVPYTAALVKRFGPARVPESAFRVAGDPGNPVVASSQGYADLAASAQRVTEEVMLHVVRRAVAATSIRDVCLAGGVALNGLGNGRIKRELGVRLYVQPAAGDAGGSLGAALYYYHHVRAGARGPPLENPLLGRAYGTTEVREALAQSFSRRYRTFQDEDELIDTVARLLHEGHVMGWFQGRFEWGPRALGARSILADPTRADMQRIVNEKIKFREPFRPFAPAVLASRAAEFFEMGTLGTTVDPEYFMLSVCQVRPEHRLRIPAVTHVDGTARVQLVDHRSQPRYHEVIRRFEKYSGVPLVLNTSFNLRGEPIVNTPLDALRTFEWSDMDYLALGDTLVAKGSVPL